MKLPKEYKPKKLVDPGDSVRRHRKSSYFIGYMESDGSIFPGHGPFYAVYEVLEIVPYNNNARIVHFKPDWTEEVIYRWKDDKWLQVNEHGQGSYENVPERKIEDES